MFLAVGYYLVVVIGFAIAHLVPRQLEGRAHDRSDLNWYLWVAAAWLPIAALIGLLSVSVSVSEPELLTIFMLSGFGSYLLPLLIVFVSLFGVMICTASALAWRSFVPPAALLSATCVIGVGTWRDGLLDWFIAAPAIWILTCFASGVVLALARWRRSHLDGDSVR